MVEVVVLDIDGTLVDSNDAHAHAWVEVLANDGVHAPFANVRRLIGKGGDKLLPEVSGIREDTPRGQKLSDARKKLFQKKYLPELRAFPGVRPLMEKILERGARLVVATSASKQEVDPLLEIAGIRDLIDKKTSSDDAENSKPDPDIVAAAIKRAKVAPERAIMLGDTPYDIEAARGAGVDCIAFRSGGWGDSDLSSAIAIYDGAAALLEGFDSSPLVTR
jgi:HAD superfamily hydrolase (TIGR01509 family)